MHTARNSSASNARSAKSLLILAGILGIFVVCVGGIYWSGGFDRWLGNNPHPERKNRVTTEHALQLVEQGRLEEAEEAFKQVLKRDPHSPLAQEELRWLYFNQFRTRDVESLIHAALEHQPAQPDLLVHALFSELRPPSPQEGLDYLQKIQQRQPGQLPVLRALGYAYWRLGKLEKAREHWNSALALAPDDTATQLLVAEFLLEQNQISSAQSLLEASSASKDDRWWWLKSRLALREDHLEAALKNLNRALEIRPFAIRYHHQQGLLLKRLGREEEAAQAFQTARKLEACQMRLTEIVLSGDLAQPSPSLCQEIAKLSEIRGKPRQALGWRLVAEQMRSSGRQAPHTLSSPF